MTLPEFLLARIAEDEAAALKCLGRDWQANGHDVGSRIDEQPFDIVRPFVGGPYAQPLRQGGLDQHGANDERLSAAMHVARHDPARVLAEVEAKRKMLMELEERAATADGGGVWFDLMCYMSRPYADHPDYRQEWKL